MAFPKTGDDCLNDLDDINALIDFVNDLTDWWNLYYKFHIGTLGTVTHLSNISSGDCYNSQSIWEPLQQRIQSIVREAVDYSLVANGQTVGTLEEAFAGGGVQVPNISLTFPDVGNSDYYERFASAVNSVLSTAGITGQNMDSSGWSTLLNLLEIPWSRSTGDRGDMVVGDCVNATVLNQIWAACKVLESCAFPGYVRSGFGAAVANRRLGGTVIDRWGMGYTDFTNPSTCAVSLNNLRTNWPGTFLAAGDGEVFAKVFKTEFSSPTQWRWSGSRARGKFEFTDVPTGTDVDIKEAVIYRQAGLDFYSPIDVAKAEDEITDVTETTANTSATVTSGYYGNYTTDTSQGANATHDCTDANGSYGYGVTGFIALRKNFTAPS